MEGVILAAGRGRRISPYIMNENKCLIRINDKPIISYNIERLLSCNEISRCIVIVGYRAESIIATLGYERFGKPITYYYQTQKKSLMGALEEALKHSKGDIFLTLGDEFVCNKLCCQNMINQYYKMQCKCLVGVSSVSAIQDVMKTYSFKEHSDGSLYEFIEKPVNPKVKIRGTGNIIFSANIKTIYYGINKDNKELVDLLNEYSIKEKHIYKFELGLDAYFNINTRSDLDKLIERVEVSI